MGGSHGGCRVMAFGHLAYVSIEYCAGGVIPSASLRQEHINSGRIHVYQ